MHRILLIILTIAVLGCQNKDSRYIAVEGKATVKAPVNYFEVRVTVATEGPTFSKANDDNKVLVRKVFEVFKKFQISDSDFVTKKSETAEATTPYLRYGLEKKLPSVEYSGTLLLRNPNLYDAIFKELVQLGKVEVGVYDFGCDSIENYRRDAYRQAVGNAKQQAELLIAGTGHKLGKIFKVLQDARDRYREYDDIESLVAKSKPSQIMAMELSPEPSTFRKKYLDVNALVTIIYEIE